MSDTLYNPFSGAEEILFRDVDGKLKVLRGEQIEPWQPPAPPVPPTTEIPAVREANDAISPSPLDSLVGRVIDALRLSLADEVLRRRLRMLVLSRFKGIRDAVETREVLSRPVAVGGMGLADAVVNSAGATIERQYQQYSDQKRYAHDMTVSSLNANVGAVASGEPAPPAPLTPLPATLAPERPPLPKVMPPSRPPQVGMPSPAPARPPVPLVGTPARVAPAVSPPGGRTTEPVWHRPAVIAPPVAAPSTPRPSVRPAPAPHMVTPPAMTAGAAPVPEPRSAQFRPKLVGPLEELRDMTVQDFRRLNADPRLATATIGEKIVLLEQQSFKHKAAAIAAWRKCQVFARYTELAGAAMADKRPIADVIGSRQMPEHDTLTVTEFEAIADFNRTLRF